MPDRTKLRDSNIELFRILTMIMIVAHHYVVHSPVLQISYVYIDKPDSLFSLIIGAWGKVGINCFVLITGYYVCKSNISLRKLLQLLLEILFYNVFIYIYLIFAGAQDLSVSSLFDTVFMMGNNSYQFAGSFILFYPLIPFINILLRNLSFRKHSLLIILLLFIFSGRATIPNIYVPLNYVTWFAIIYIIGAYFNIQREKLPGFLYKWKPMTVISFVAILIGILSIIQGVELSKITEDQLAWYYLVDANKLLAVIISISLFLLFKSIRIPHSRIINIIAGATFGVLLIHSNCMEMTVYIWDNIHPETHMFTNTYCIYAIGCILCLYIICTIIDIGRKYLLEKPLFRLFGSKIDSTENTIKCKIKGQKQS